MRVEELKYGASPVSSLLQGGLHLVHSLVVGVPLEHLADVLEQVADLVRQLRREDYDRGTRWGRR